MIIMHTKEIVVALVITIDVVPKPVVCFTFSFHLFVADGEGWDLSPWRMGRGVCLRTTVTLKMYILTND